MVWGDDSIGGLTTDDSTPPNSSPPNGVGEIGFDRTEPRGGHRSTRRAHSRCLRRRRELVQRRERGYPDSASGLDSVAGSNNRSGFVVGFDGIADATSDVADPNSTASHSSWYDVVAGFDGIAGSTGEQSWW